VYFEVEEGVDGEALVRELRDEFNVWIGGETAHIAYESGSPYFSRRDALWFRHLGADYVT
jgi:hypothetical protein